MSKNETVHTPSVLLAEGEIKTKIKSVHSRAGILQKDMHLIACSIHAHMMKHKDIRLVNDFLEKMPKGQRINALKQWFEEYSVITYVKNKATFDPLKLVDAARIMNDGFNKPFWDLKSNEGDDYQAMDVFGDINKLIGKLNKDAEKTNRDHSDLTHILTMYIKHKEAQEQNTVDAPVLMLEHAA